MIHGPPAATLPARPARTALRAAQAAAAGLIAGFALHAALPRIRRRHGRI